MDLQDNDGWSALLVACDRTAPPCRTGSGMGSAVWARSRRCVVTPCRAGNGHAEIVQALLDAEAGVELQNRLGETALQLATKFSHLEAQQVLVEAGADPTGITLIGLGDNYAKDTDTEEPCTDPVDPRDDPGQHPTNSLPVHDRLRRVTCCHTTEAEDYVNVNNLPRHAKASIAVANEARLKYFLTQLGLGEHFLSFKKFGVKATADLKVPSRTPCNFAWCK